MERISEYDAEQLLKACGVMESTIVKFIRELESQGIDSTTLRRGLNEAHEAVDEIGDGKC